MPFQPGPLLCAIPRSVVIVLLIQSQQGGLAYLPLFPDVLRFPAAVRILIPCLLQTLCARKSGVIPCSKFGPALVLKNDVPVSNYVLDPLAAFLAANKRGYLSLLPVSESLCCHGSQWQILLHSLCVPCPLAQTHCPQQFIALN